MKKRSYRIYRTSLIDSTRSIIHRFEMMMDGSNGRKNHKIVQINERVDLANCVFGTDERPLRYRLVSMVIHHGPRLNSGHYTAVGVTSSGPYYFFNDSNVREFELFLYKVVLFIY